MLDAKIRDDSFQTTGGLPTLAPAGVALFRALDRQFLRWAEACGAIEKRYPVLMRVEDLARFDYFRNFPHIAVCACGIDSGGQEHYASRSTSVVEIPPQHLTNADHVLAPAACYNIYLDYQDTALTRPLKVTTITECHRNESNYTGLARLRGFSMREIVCIGSAEDVKRHVADTKETVMRFLDKLKVPVDIEVASDPFFDRSSQRALLSRMFPTKEELCYAGEVAVGSFNFHRNFFGERCGITFGGECAFSGCVAFGVERWIHMMLQHYGDAALATAALDAALPRGA
jgi:seryl-tRNA synthetase